MNDVTPVLSVGSNIDSIGDSASWTSEYNIKGYKHVFLDYYSLEKSISQDLVGNPPDTPQKSDVFRSIKSGNRIYVLLPESSVLRYGGMMIKLGDIFYGGVSLTEEGGEYIDPDSIVSEWEWYFTNHFQWNVRLEINNAIFELGQRKFGLDFSPIVTNLSDEPLSCVATYSELGGSNSDHIGSRDMFSGRVFFIPVINDWTSGELINSVIEHKTDITVTPDEQNNPEWVSKWSLPSEEETREQVSAVEDEIQSRIQKLETLETEIEEFEQYKNLLWGNEGVLERLVPSVFEEIGFDVEGEEPHGRDGMIYLEDTVFVLEIFGTKNDISDSKYRQLIDWVGDAEADDENPENRYVGLLVANPRRLEEPKSRNPDEYLPTHLSRRMEQKGFRLLLTPTLYEMLQDYRKGDISTEDIRQALLSDKLVVEIDYSQ